MLHALVSAIGTAPRLSGFDALKPADKTRVQKAFEPKAIAPFPRHKVSPAILQPSPAEPQPIPGKGSSGALAIDIGADKSDPEGRQGELGPRVRGAELPARTSLRPANWSFGTG